MAWRSSGRRGRRRRQCGRPRGDSLLEEVEDDDAESVARFDLLCAASVNGGERRERGVHGSPHGPLVPLRQSFPVFQQKMTMPLMFRNHLKNIVHLYIFDESKLR